MPPGQHEPFCGLPEREEDHFTPAHDPQARRSFGVGLAPWQAKCPCGWLVWVMTKTEAQRRADAHAESVAA